jgi:hypothetical protein
MDKEFIPYELALRMKALGFDEPCFAYYYTLNGRDWKFAEKTEYYRLDDNMNIGSKFTISAPLYQQAFRWFREKHRLKHIWVMDELLDTGEYTYEEAELACLKYCIEIVESKSE